MGRKEKRKKHMFNIEKTRNIRKYKENSMDIIIWTSIKECLSYILAL